MPATADQLRLRPDSRSRHFSHARNEPAWLVEQRREAWQTFCEKDWPQRSDEEWIRTDIRLFKLESISLCRGDDAPAPQRKRAAPQALLTEGVDLAGDTTALDSRPHASHAQAEVGRQRRALRQPRRAGRDARRSDPQASVHAGRRSELRQVRGPARRLLVGRARCSMCRAASSIDEPLHCLSAMTSGGVDLGHTLVVLEEGAEATLHVRDGQRLGRRAAGFHCGATEVDPRPQRRGCDW